MASSFDSLFTGDNDPSSDGEQIQETTEDTSGPDDDKELIDNLRSG